MSTHLSSEQITAWVVGERGQEADCHLGECAACRIEVRGLEETLLAFRSSAREWSDEQFNPNFRLPANRREERSWIRGFSWAVAALVLCLFLGRLISRSVPANAVPRDATSDADLLKEIDQEVSRTVPGPMEPLTELVSWDANSSTSAAQKSRQRVAQ